VPDDFLLSLGIHVPYFIAGFAGAVSIAFEDKKPDAWSFVGTLMAGAFAANYFAPYLERHVPGLLAAYFIGTVGKLVARQSAIFAKRLIKRVSE
jgi:hypothetical protein